MPNAYPYIRFSRDEQARGDSLRRQLEKSREFAQQHGLVLCEPIQDLGVSAYEGANIEKGAFAGFFRRVETGEIERGSYLLVESIDRISRTRPIVALKPFLALLEAGINIVTLLDGQMYTSDKQGDEGWIQLLMSLTYMARAHDESATKSRRIRARWEKKRAEIAQQKLTARCPAWLRLSPSRTTFEVIEDRANVVRCIFEDAANGLGVNSIVRKLNGGVNGIVTEPFGRSDAWHPSYVKKILQSTAALGEFQPHVKISGRRRPEGPAIPDYYPRIVSEALFAEAQSAIADRRVNFAGRKGRRLANLLSGLCSCWQCSGSMTFRSKGRNEDYLVCNNAMRGARGCTNRTHFNYRRLEEGILNYVLHLALDPDDLGRQGDVAPVEEELAELVRSAATKRAEANRMIDILSRGDLPMVEQRLRTLHQEIDDAEKRKKEVEKHLYELRGRRSGEEYLELLTAFRTRLEDADATVRHTARARVMQALHGVIELISFDPADRMVTVGLVGGVRAFRFLDGRLIDEYDLSALVDRSIPKPRFTFGNAIREKRLDRLLRRIAFGRGPVPDVGSETDRTTPSSEADLDG